MDKPLLSLHTVGIVNKREFLRQFGQRIAELRKEKGLTQEQLADIIEVHRTYIGFIEQGKRNPTIVNIYKIAKALKTSLKEIFSKF